MLRVAGRGASGLTDLDDQALAWVELTFGGQATADELMALEVWRHQTPEHEAAYSLALRLRRAAGAYALGSDDHYRATLLNRPSSRRAILAGLGTVVIGGYAAAKPPLGLWPSLAELSSDYRTAVGERRNISVADGVAVDMNARTSVALRNDSAGPGIEIVEGEAAIVTRAADPKPFHIIAGAGRVLAETASLNVQNDAGLVRVTCVSGAASIEHPAGHQRVGANQQVRYSGQAILPPETVDAAMVTAWQRGLLIFHQTRLEQVVAEVNRYRPGKIVLTNDELANRRFSGSVRIDRVDEVVPLIRKSTNASAVTLGSVILLS